MNCLDNSLVAIRVGVGARIGGKLKTGIRVRLRKGLQDGAGSGKREVPPGRRFRQEKQQ